MVESVQAQVIEFFNVLINIVIALTHENKLQFIMTTLNTTSIKSKNISIGRYCIFILAFSISFYESSGQSFENDICLPSKLYMLSDTQNDIFTEPLIKRWRPYNDVVRFTGTATYQRRLQRVASLNEPKENTTITISLVNQDEFKTIKSITSTIVVGEKGIGKHAIPVSIIGDSFTHGAFFKDALLTKEYVPNIQMIGSREVKDYPGQFDEGRGGWTLARYCMVSNKRTQAYNGFWQPEGRYKYWGSTDFWLLVKDIQSNPKGDWTFGEKYNTSRFESKAELYNDKKGYKLKPNVDDVMYDNSKDQYVRFDGSKWKDIDDEGFSWSFNYEKYLSMWQLKSPLILAEFLGLNDFRNAPDPTSIDFTSWNDQMEKVIASYLKAVPDGRFVLMIPSSTCGILDNKAGDFTTKQNVCMWELRRNIIEIFDNRENENIYIVDSGIAIDNMNGTRFLTDSIYTLTYNSYSGIDRIAVQTGNPHPYTNYPTMGISFAAFIQKYRQE
ncbi:MAG: hypothetical protein ACJA2S_003990 [Cyclobacteriaceae bacterium]